LCISSYASCYRCVIDASSQKWKPFYMIAQRLDRFDISLGLISKKVLIKMIFIYGSRCMQPAKKVLCSSLYIEVFIRNLIGGLIIDFTGSYCHTTNINVELWAIFYKSHICFRKIIGVEFLNDIGLYQGYIGCTYSSFFCPFHYYAPLIDNICFFM
jgi:hypothetical protein